MIKEQYKYSELTSKIIGCAMTVHKTLGNARLTGRAGFPGSNLSKSIGNGNEFGRYFI
jgi:hypothetical protein